MADDGMIVNFNIDNGLINLNPSFKGGSWKDRLTAKKAVFYARQKAAKQVDVQTNEASEAAKLQNDQVQIRSSKRPRLGSDTAPGNAVTTKKNALPKRAHGEMKPRQVVSSLFSFNPTSRTVEVESKEEATESAKPSNAPLDSELDTFTSLGLSAPLAEHLLKKMNVKAPTAIQRAAVTQLIREDADAFIQAETGSGKTLAYLLPIVQKIMHLSSNPVGESHDDGGGGPIRRHSGLFAIILTPTRELSKQISVVLESLLRCAHWIVPGIVVGGEKKKSEKARLRKGVNILIATPGRLADHLDNTEVLDVSNVRWLVLDEGDRLMELGFEQDITKILAKVDARKSDKTTIPGLPNRRTNIMCSATMKMNVQKLGEISLKDAVHIHINEPRTAESNDMQMEELHTFSAPAQLKQSYAIVPAKLRLVSLTAVLKRAFARRGSVKKAIVFISCADSVDFHFEVLTRPDPDQAEVVIEEEGKVQSNTLTPRTTDQPASVRTTAKSPTLSTKDNPIQLFRLHGSLPQPVRTSTLNAFRHCKTAAVLICTDVASRGLDLPNVDFVIQYDPPFTKDDNLHRIGRTARAGNAGRALLFLLPGAEEGYLDVLRDDSTKLARTEVTEVLKRGFGSGSGGNGWEEHATAWQLEVERWALENRRYLELARQAYQSHIRAYATHVAAERGIFDMAGLHLGHLAKAFALRDRPSRIRAPGLRVGKDGGDAVRAERKRGKPEAIAAEGTQSGSAQAARKMRAKLTERGKDADEYNVG